MLMRVGISLLVVTLMVLGWNTQMERLGVQILTQTVPNLNTPKAWGGGCGSRGDRAATCVSWVP